MAKLQSLLNLAESQVSYPEKDNANNLDSFTVCGTGNYTKYARDINAIGLSGCQGQPWCGVYQMWLEYKNSDKSTALSHLGSTFYNCFSTMNWAKNNGKWIATTGTPKPGYRVIFSQSHVALVTKVTGTYNSGKIYTNEGNTSDGTGVNRDGGRVCNKSYDRSYSKILGYVAVDYEDTSSADVSSTYEITVSSAGLNVMVAFLNVRNYPKTGAIVGGYEQGDVIKPTHKCFVDGDAWFKTDKGWISGKYLEGWIQELSDADQRWWYVKSGYTYSVSEWVEYNDAWYYIDKDGWMATNVYVESADKNVYYWLNGDGVWEPKWDTATPDLSKYKLVV